MLSTILNKISNLPKSAKLNLGKTSLSLKQYSPDILLGLGIISGIASACMLVSAARKHDVVLSEDLKKLESETFILNHPAADIILTQKEKIQTLAPICGTIVGKTIRLYGPGVALGASSITLILASHGIIKDRNKALLSLVQLLEFGFSQYRSRVREEVGEEDEQRLYLGTSVKTRIIKNINEDGTKDKTIVKDQFIPEDYSPEMYTRLLDPSNDLWNTSKTMTEWVLKTNQNMCNQILKGRGYLFLNDVLKGLNFSETSYGQVVGWALDDDGDGFVDFGLDMAVNQDSGDYFVLDFNVTGVILKHVDIINKNEK